MSILNALLMAGVIAVIISEARVFEDIASIYLKHYYKQTAVALNLKKQKKSSPNKNIAIKITP
jgi:hypothetical protein